MPTPTEIVKTEAHRLVNELPEGAGWEELAYAIYVREKVERGRADARAGRSRSQDDILKEFGLAE